MRVLLIIVGFILLTISCVKTDDCSKDILIVDNIETESSGGINIRSLEIDEECIYFELSIGGCDNNHEVDLITSGNYEGTDNIVITLAFRDNDPQTCKALFYKNYSYNLSVIDDIMDNNNEVVIYFKGSDQSIVYTK